MNEVERLERMLDLALLESDLYREAWKAEQRLKWTLAGRLATAAGERDVFLKERSPMNEDQTRVLKEALAASDALTSAVISGRAGTMSAALDVARAFNDMKKCGLGHLLK